MVEMHIKNFVKRENCIIGVCDAAPLTIDVTGFTPFVSRDSLKRTDPAANLPGAKSIIVAGVPYVNKNFPPVPEGAGILSVLGVAGDYHIVVKTLLKKLVAELQLHTNFMYKILVDSPTLDERALAVRAGLGFIGRSGLVISPEYGSRFNIGLLLTDIDMPSSPVNIKALSEARQSTEPGLLRSYNPRNDGEGGYGAAHNKLPVATCSPDCSSCISACPTRALSESVGYDVTRCISYLTQKDNLTPDESTLIGRHLYGCDICQDACPHNIQQPTAWANPKDWLSMNDDDFANTYGRTAMLWRGTALLRRNAKAVIDNVKQFIK